MIRKILAWLILRNCKQSTFVFCPKCGLELCNTNSFQSDTDVVRYKCAQCRTVSVWLFDAPVPIFLGTEL